MSNTQGMSAGQTISALIDALRAIESMSLQGAKANGAHAKIALSMMAVVARDAIDKTPGAAA